MLLDEIVCATILSVVQFVLKLLFLPELILSSFNSIKVVMFQSTQIHLGYVRHLSCRRVLELLAIMDW